MKMLVKGHSLNLYRSCDDTYSISCSCLFASEEESFTDIILSAVRHVDYSYRDYEQDSTWYARWQTDALTERQRDILQDTSIPLDQAAELIGKLDAEKERYDTLDFILPVLRDHFSRQRV